MNSLKASATGDSSKVKAAQDAAVLAAEKTKDDKWTAKLKAALAAEQTMHQDAMAKAMAQADADKAAAIKQAAFDAVADYMAKMSSSGGGGMSGSSSAASGGGGGGVSGSSSSTGSSSGGGGSTVTSERFNPVCDGISTYFSVTKTGPYPTSFDESWVEEVLKDFGLPSHLLSKTNVQETDSEIARYQISPITFNGECTFVAFKEPIDTEYDVFYCGEWRPTKNVTTLRFPPDCPS